AIGAREEHPAITRQISDRGFERARIRRLGDRDRGKEERLGAALPHRVRGLARLLLGAEESESLAEQGFAIEPGEPIAQPDDVPPDDDRRVLETPSARDLRDLAGRRDGDALPRARSPVDYGDGRVGRATAFEDGARDLLDAA